MTRRGACAPRCLLARTLGVERLEDRWLLSSFGTPSDPQSVGFTVDSSPILVLVSGAPMASPGDPSTPDGLGDITAGDAGSFRGGIGQGITAVVSPLPNSPTTLPTVVVTDPGTSTSDTPGSASGTAADAASSSVLNELPVEPSPVILQVIAPSSLLSSTASLASAGGPIAIAEGTGSSALESELPGGAVTVSSPANPSLLASFATLAGTGGGQTRGAFSVLGGGAVLPVYLFYSTTGEVHPPLVMAFDFGDPTTQESPAAFAIVTSGSARLAPPVAGTPDGSIGITTNGSSSPGAAGNSSNAATVVGISTVGLAPSGTSQVRGNASSLLARDRNLTLAGRRLGEVPPYRDVSDPGNQGTVATAEADPRRMVEKAGLFGLAVPSPQRSDLIVDFKPFDQTAGEQTIDQFLQQFENLGTGLSWLEGPTDLVVELLALAVALAAWKVVPKVLGRSPDADELAAVDVATSLDGISGLPGGSNPEET
jgi:hypothetical protein